MLRSNYLDWQSRIWTRLNATHRQTIPKRHAWLSIKKTFPPFPVSRFPTLQFQFGGTFSSLAFSSLAFSAPPPLPSNSVVSDTQFIGAAITRPRSHYNLITKLFNNAYDTTKILNLLRLSRRKRLYSTAFRQLLVTVRAPERSQLISVDPELSSGRL